MRDDVKVVFSAADEFSATLNKFKGGLTGAESAAATSAGRIERELGKLTSASELAAGGLRRIRSTLEGMAFGAIVGVASAVTQEFINMWQRSFNVEEILDKLNTTILSQASSWKILPEPMRAVAQSTVDIYNAQLKLSQFYGVSEIPKLKKEMEDLQKANEMAGAEIYQNAQLLGPYNAGLFNTEILNRKNQETILQNNVTLAEKREKLRQLVEIQDLQTTSLGKVNSATSKQTELVSESVLQDRNWLTLNLAYMEYLKTEEENFRQRLLSTPLNLYWLPTDEEIARKTSAMLNASKAVALAEEQLRTARQQQSPYEQYTRDIVAGSSPVARAIFEGEEKLRIMQEFQRRETELIVADMAAKLQLAQMRGASEIEIAMMTAQNTMQIEEMILEHKEMMERMKTQVGISQLGQSLSATGAMMMQGGKKQFEIGKAAALAGAIVSGAQAVTNALAVPPFPLGLALAALAAARTLLQIQTIKNTQFMGGGTAFSGAGGGAPSPMFSGSGAGSTPTSLTEQQQQSQPVTINLTVVNPLSDDNWAKITEEQVVPYLEKYTQRGGTVNLNIV